MTTTTATPSRTSPSTSTSRSAPATTPPTPTTTPTTAAVTAGSSAFMKGHKGPDVAALQERLNRAGATPPLATDGDFGTKTRAAVERFQHQHHLPVDGMVGARTIAALDATAPATPSTPSATDSLERGGGTSTGRSAPAAPSTPAPTTAAPRRGLSASSTTNASTAANASTANASTTLPAGLDAAARTTITTALNGGNGPEARTALTTLMGSAQFRGMAAPAQARLLTSVHASASGPIGMLGAIAGGGADTATVRGRQITHAANQAHALLQSTASRTGSPADRAQLVEIHAASPGGRASLLGLAGENGGPNRLAARDLRGGSMLSNLATMATQPLGTGINRNDLLASTMGEVRNPATIEQQRQGTCAATSVTLQLVGRSPAEYVRLLAGVSSRAGTTPMANGTTLRRVDESITDTATRRSISERLLQDSFMDVANGSIRYTIAGNTGLTSAESARLLTAVFNQPHHAVQDSGRFTVPRDASLASRTWSALRNGWDRVTFQHDANRPMQIVRERSGQPTQIGMRWGTTADANHAVVVTKVENGRVFFQNPHGNATRTPGQLLDTPPRRVEQGNVQSMTVAEFASRIYSVTIPD